MVQGSTYNKQRKVSLLVDETQLAGCGRVWVSGPLERTQAFSDYAQDVIQDTIYEASMSAATPDWWIVLSC